jgi:hypothetical protein
VIVLAGEESLVREPQEIEDEEHEQVLDRVAAVDVAKASGMVCTRVPHPLQPGRRLTRVQEVDATTNAISELAEHLARLGVQKVTLSTRASARWPVSALACVAGNCGVRSPGKKPKRPLCHPGGAGKEKTGGRRRLSGPGAASGRPGVMGERE